VLAQQRATASNIFGEDLTRQLAVERAFQAAIEACLDIAAHIVAVYQLGRSEENRDVFRFLVAAYRVVAVFSNVGERVVETQTNHRVLA
jgi:uncharacterized protein YutE (UPF0331/DUF86 family)